MSMSFSCELRKSMLICHRFEYLWQDNENFKRPTKMPAPTYIEHLMAWVQASIDNETVFPSRIGMHFNNVYQLHTMSL